MESRTHYSAHSFLSLLAKEYPSVQAVVSEVINLQAILRLPKPTEHFMSDLHGEHEAFTHILSNASGVIKEKVDRVLSGRADAQQRAQFATLIYYPEKKLEMLKRQGTIDDEWYRQTILDLLDVCRVIASKYTRSFIRKRLPEQFSYILDELLHAHFEDHDKEAYYNRILSAIIDAGAADGFMIVLTQLIKKIAVYKLHIVGDIFDRGARPDIIMEKLIAHHSVDIQWGNHDVLWMGAAAGSALCVTHVVHAALAYNNIESLENGYGISLRPLSLFAEETYKKADVHRFFPKFIQHEPRSQQESRRTARMRKAIAMILFKLECQAIERNPDFAMADRALLRRVDFEQQTVVVDGTLYPMEDCDFPTVSQRAPAELTDDEREVIEQLCQSFAQSEKLERHMRFLLNKGSIYKIENGNLFFHGSIPLTEKGEMATIQYRGHAYGGKNWIDKCEREARLAYTGQDDNEKQRGQDFLWYLWCGKHSPIFGRDKMALFELLFIDDKRAHKERKNPYYTFIEADDQTAERTAAMLFAAFHLDFHRGHIINGHVPVRTGKGENPIKAGGRILVIDGGFCRAYHERTGIAGYTLVYSSRSLSLRSHSPFESTEKAIEENKDILSVVDVVENSTSRVFVQDTDEGKRILQQIEDLNALRHAYETGMIQPPQPTMATR